MSRPARLIATGSPTSLSNLDARAFSKLLLAVSDDPSRLHAGHRESVRAPVKAGFHPRPVGENGFAFPYYPDASSLVCVLAALGSVGKNAPWAVTVTSAGSPRSGPMAASPKATMRSSVDAIADQFYANHLSGKLGGGVGTQRMIFELAIRPPDLVERPRSRRTLTQRLSGSMLHH